MIENENGYYSTDILTEQGRPDKSLIERISRKELEKVFSDLVNDGFFFIVEFSIYNNSRVLANVPLYEDLLDEFADYMDIIISQPWR